MESPGNGAGSDVAQEVLGAEHHSGMGMGFQKAAPRAPISHQYPHGFLLVISQSEASRAERPRQAVLAHRETSSGSCCIPGLLQAQSLPPASFWSLFPGFSLFLLCTWEPQAQTQPGPRFPLGSPGLGSSRIGPWDEEVGRRKRSLRHLLVRCQQQRLNWHKSTEELPLLVCAAPAATAVLCMRGSVCVRSSHPWTLRVPGLLCVCMDVVLR